MAAATTTRRKQKNRLTIGDVFATRTASHDDNRARYERWVQKIASNDDPTIDEADELAGLTELLDLSQEQLANDVQDLKNLAANEAVMAKADPKALEAAAVAAAVKFKKSFSREDQIALNKAATARKIWGSYSQQAQRVRRRFPHLYPEVS
jgi:hypothetical protein